jgi:hypothetical protein
VPRRQGPPRRSSRSQTELTPLSRIASDAAPVGSSTPGSGISAAIDRRGPDPMAIRPDIRSAIRPDIWPAIGPGIRPAIRSDVRPVVRPNIRSAIRPDVRPIRPGIRPTIGSDIRPAIGSDIWPAIRSGIRPAIRSPVGSGVWPDIRSRIWSDVLPGILCRRGRLIGIHLCLQVSGTEDQEGSQPENSHAKHLKLLTESSCLGRPPRPATKTIRSRKGHNRPRAMQSYERWTP